MLCRCCPWYLLVLGVAVCLAVVCHLVAGACSTALAEVFVQLPAVSTQGAVVGCRVFLKLQKEHGSFDNYVWSFVPNKQPIVGAWSDIKQVPAK